MLRGRDLRVGGRDASIRTDDVRDPAGRRRVGRVAGSVSQPDFSLGVAEERKIEGELLRERRVLGDGVEGDAEDLGVALLKFGAEVPEPETFLRSPRRIGLGIEPENDRLSPVVGETLSLAGVIGDSEVRGLVADVQHFALEPDHISEHGGKYAKRPSRASCHGAPSFGRRGERFISQSLPHLRKTPYA